MALAIDSSTPAIATQTNSATATVTTASFTPPANSVLLIGWSANSQSGTNPASPSITDNLGVHLTYTLLDWQSRANAPTVNGQVAQWSAVVGSSAAMTVTVTTGAASGLREAALCVTVLTGANTTTPIGAHSKSGSNSTATVSATYTASATNGWGFSSVCDWDALGNMTAGTGCTIQGTGSPGSQYSYGFTRRTSADDTNGVSNTVTTNLAGTSINVAYAWAEVLPGASVTSNLPTSAVVVTPVRPVARDLAKGQVSYESNLYLTPIVAGPTVIPPAIVDTPNRPPAGVAWVGRVGERVEGVDLTLPVVVTSTRPPPGAVWVARTSERVTDTDVTVPVVVAAPRTSSGELVTFIGRADPIVTTDVVVPPMVEVPPTVTPRSAVVVTRSSGADPVIVPGDTVIPPEVAVGSTRPGAGELVVPQAFSPQVVTAPDVVLPPVVEVASALVRPVPAVVVVGQEGVEQPPPPVPVTAVSSTGPVRPGFVSVPATRAEPDRPGAPPPLVSVVRRRDTLAVVWRHIPRRDPSAIVPDVAASSAPAAAARRVSTSGVSGRKAATPNVYRRRTDNPGVSHG